MCKRMLSCVWVLSCDHDSRLEAARALGCVVGAPCSLMSVESCMLVFKPYVAPRFGKAVSLGPTSPHVCLSECLVHCSDRMFRNRLGQGVDVHVLSGRPGHSAGMAHESESTPVELHALEKLPNFLALQSEYGPDSSQKRPDLRASWNDSKHPVPTPQCAGLVNSRSERFTNSPPQQVRTRAHAASFGFAPISIVCPI